MNKITYAYFPNTTWDALALFFLNEILIYQDIL